MAIEELVSFRKEAVHPLFKAALMACLALPLCTRAAVFSGTGFFISPDGYIATNDHVIDGADEIRIRDFRGNVSKAEVVLRDKSNDIAVLKIDGSGLSALPIRNSSEVRKGTAVFTIGFPNATIQGRESKVTEGVISSLSGLSGAPNSFQISAPIQPGNSGGPLVDMTGAVVGLTTSKLNASAMLKIGGALPENVNYAVKSNYLLELIATDRNLTSRVIRPTNQNARQLITLIDKAESATVFIVAVVKSVTDEGAPVKSGDVPRYISDAQALEDFKRGTAAYQRGAFQEALKYLGQAGTAGHADSQGLVGFMYANGIGVEKDYLEAIRWYRKAVAQGNAAAQNNLGLMYANGRGVTKDSAEAVRWYRRSAEQGLADAQFWLGLAYSDGIGLQKDAVEAMRWLRKAADQNLANAQYSVGYGYLSGLGVPINEVEAARWLQKAAEQGLAEAQLLLAGLYLEGNGVAQSSSKGLQWLSRAVEQGLPDAQYMQGYIFASGRFVQKNNSEAIRWFLRAAEQGFAEAQFALGKVYEEGDMVARDDAAAVQWYRKAADLGHADSQARLKALGQ
ncbi:MAG: SEL1-like repeat protein [Burkholderiaceae bacterium]|nr:SEL1-like repeat protein [Burkholderiaceae bacterium]